MTVLYVLQPGAEVRKQAERLYVQWQGETLTTLPLREVERVILLGPAQLTATATRALLAANIPVVFCNTKGRYYGVLSTGHENTEILLAQVERYHDVTYRLAIAKAIVSAKIYHSCALLRRYVRNHPNPEVQATVDQLPSLLGSLDEASSLPQVVGVEGRAAALYFAAYGKCFLPEELRFTERTRRPPRDPVNALLSLGYMLLLGEMVGALAGQGLHLGLGFLHEVSSCRPALALDLLEIFRQPIVDRLTLSLFNRRVFSPADFQFSSDGKVTLKEKALRRYLVFYEKALVASFQYSGAQKAVSFRALIQEQAQSLKIAIQKGTAWAPLTLRI